MTSDDDRMSALPIIKAKLVVPIPAKWVVSRVLAQQIGLPILSR